MQETSRNQVPSFLQKGSFFETLDADDEEKFEVPSDCMKADTNITSDQDLRHLLHSVRFWGVYEIPDVVFKFILKNASKDHRDPLLAEFPEFASFLSKIFDLKTCDPAQAISLAVSHQLSIHVVKFLHEAMGFNLDHEVWKAAAEHNDLLCVKYLHEKKIKNETLDIIVVMLEHGSLKCLEYVHEMGWEFPVGLADIAVAGGNLECVKFILKICGPTFTADTMSFASLVPDLELIRYLYEAGCPWSLQVCKLLARKDALDGLIFAHENGCPWDASTCAFAASKGHLRCLEYAHLQGCPWDELTIEWAVMGGNVACLAYAYQHRCPGTEDALWYALYYRSWACGRYLLFDIGLSQDTVCTLCLTALCCGSLALMVYNSHYDLCSWERTIFIGLFPHLWVPMIRFNKVDVSTYWLNIIGRVSIAITYYAVSSHYHCDEEI